MGVIFVDDAEMPRLKGQLEELLNLEEGLSKYELDFLDGSEGLTKWDGNFSIKQAAKLDKIYTERC